MTISCQEAWEQWKMHRAQYAPWLRARPPGLSKRTVTVRTPLETQAGAARGVGWCIRMGRMVIEKLKERTS